MDVGYVRLIQNYILMTPNWKFFYGVHAVTSGVKNNTAFQKELIIPIGEHSGLMARFTSVVAAKGHTNGSLAFHCDYFLVKSASIKICSI